MREEVTVVLRLPLDHEEDWELHGVYGTHADAERAIDYALLHDDDAEFVTHTAPVLSFPEWVR